MAVRHQAAVAATVVTAAVAAEAVAAAEAAVGVAARHHAVAAAIPEAAVAVSDDQNMPLRLHGYSCNRNRFADCETNSNAGVLTKLFYNTSSRPERWRFAYDKRGVCLRETSTLVPANFPFHYFKLSSL